MFCSVRWALVLLALLEWVDARTGKADLSWSVPGMHLCLFACHWKVILVGETPTLASCGLAQYGTVLVQWYVMHSHERCLPGSMIHDEFEVCFELLLSVMLAKRRLWRVPVRVPCQSHIPGAQEMARFRGVEEDLLLKTFKYKHEEINPNYMNTCSLFQTPHGNTLYKAACWIKLPQRPGSKFQRGNNGRHRLK
jgi:hypothetical protein